jgi:hypothetical protein
MEIVKPKEEKKHECKDDNLKCISTDRKGVFQIYNKQYSHDGEDIGWLIVGEYCCCPFCGENK